MITNVPESLGGPPPDRLSPPLGRAILGLSAVGFPLTQVAIVRFGRRGAIAVELVTAGLLIRDLVLVARGTPRRLRPGPAVLLGLETVAAGAAAALGLPAVRDRSALDQAQARRATGLEIVRRAAVGSLFGLHTARFRIYLQPDRGLRQPAPTARTEDAGAPAAAAAGASDRPHRLTRVERTGLTVHRGLDRWLSPLGVAAYRGTHGAIADPWKRDVLLLTTTGRRSGRQRTVVLQYFRDGDAMILAAANDGARTHPGWYFNLTAEPLATVEVGTRRMPVRAEEVEPMEAATWWRRIVERDPTYARYAWATDRRIPIVRLVRRDGVGAATAGAVGGERVSVRP